MKKIMNLLILIVLFSCVNKRNDGNYLKDGENFLTINGIEHWVKIKGSTHKTTPIIILHGGPGGNNYNFERTIGPLLEKFATLVYYEQRGCGRTKAPIDTTDYEIPTLISDLDGLREKLDFEKMILLGYSFGAELALRYAQQDPDKVKQLILSSPAELSTSNKLVQIQGFYSIGNRILREKIEKTIMEPTTIDDKYIKIWGMVSTPVADSFLFINQDVAKKNRKLWRESKLPNKGSRHFREVIFKSSKGDLLKTVHGLEIKCLIISGIHDKNGGLHTGIVLNQILPHSELKLYKNSAHFPDMEESDSFAMDVKSFILEN